MKALNFLSKIMKVSGYLTLSALVMLMASILSWPLVGWSIAWKAVISSIAFLFTVATIYHIANKLAESIRKDPAYKISFVRVNGYLQIISLTVIMVLCVGWPWIGFAFSWKMAVTLLVFMFVNLTISEGLKNNFSRNNENAESGQYLK
ncbi:hypothetical protein BA6E_12520 [Bacteroidales bacterium 6E]|nr:hypothetical protein BA6E_12520 [Bacteroidales bacterium 6E]